MTSRITAGFLVLLVAAIYWISLNGTVAGDAQLLLSDSRIHSFTWENVGLIFSKSYYYGSVEQSVFRPVTTLSFLLTNAMLSLQARPWPDHLLNLLLHALNVLLVWLIAQAVWTRSPRAAEGPWFVQIASCFTAAIFAVHPVNAEAVANIAGRADLLAALGVLAGLAWHVRETPSPRGKGFAILLAAGLIGMFSKENAVLLPAAMLLYDLVFRSREEIRKLVHHYAGAGLALTVLLWVRFLLVAGWFSQAHPFLDNPLTGLGFLEARFTAAEVVWRYIGLLLWPQYLSWDYSFNQIPPATIGGGWLALAGLGVLTTWFVRSYRNDRPVCFLGLFFLLALLPTSNLILLIGSIMAERFLYLPSVGFAGCAAAAVTWAALRIGTKRGSVFARAALALVTVALAVRCLDRANEWSDYGRLYAHDVLTSPNSHKTHVARMDMIERTSVDFQGGIREGEAAVAILKSVPPEQNNVRVYTSLAALYGVQGDVYDLVLPATARVYYDRALELYNTAEQIDQALDRQLRKLQIAAGKPPDRILKSGLPDVYLGLIAIGRRLNNYPGALRAAEYLTQLTPGDPKVYATLATIQTQLGDMKGAILSHWKALALENPPAGEETSLLTAYRKLAPPLAGGSDCSVTGDTINQDCGPVRNVRCAARRQIAEALANAGLVDDASQARRKASEAGCTEDTR